MRVLSIPFEGLAPPHEAVVGIGVFDGLHLGHQALLRSVIAKASEHGCRSIALTFSPHPCHLLQKTTNLQLIEPLSQRLNKISSLGVDIAAVAQFTHHFARMTPSEFAKNILKIRLQAKHVVVGHDFRFGSKQGGHIACLIREGAKHGFAVHAFDTTTQHDAPVSSTRIRELLRAGAPFEASILLGAPYRVRGRVISRPKSTRNLMGFPLAQIDELRPRLLPSGVYAASIKVQSLGRFDGIYGICPDDQKAAFGAPAIIHLYGYHGAKFCAAQVCVDVVSQLHDWPSIADPMMWRTLVSADQARTLSLNQRSRLLFEDSFEDN